MDRISTEYPVINPRQNSSFVEFDITKETAANQPYCAVYAPHALICYLTY